MPTPSHPRAAATGRRRSGELPAPATSLHAETPSTAVVVPIRSFEGALSRLSEVMDGFGRRELMRLMAERVVDAADGLPIHVATDDAGVADWARGMGAAVVGAGRPGLSLAVALAVDRLAAAGIERAVVAHADLALARTLRPAVGSGMTIVPDRRRDGSNVLCVPTGVGFRFAYGPGSFERHIAEAGRLGLAVTVLDDPDLATDIDDPGDLRRLPDEYWRRLPDDCFRAPAPGPLAARR